MVKTTGVPWSEELDEVVDLTDYAVETRYPGLFGEITDEEYRRAAEVAERILIWAEDLLEEKAQP